MTPATYCDNGIHHIGKSDRCWRCELWERQKAKGQIFHAAFNAFTLRSYLRGR